MREMTAKEAGPVAAPSMAPRVRKAMSEPAFHAAAEAAAMTAAPNSPHRNRRRWPSRSPSLPTRGPMTPKASMGPVTTQVMVASLVRSSSAMVWMETARMVTVTFTENSPNSTVARIRHRLSGATPSTRVVRRGAVIGAHRT